jgi:phenylpropionate dioxygenase-like ring-hydroxylating dioxygenase large terminal subunit
MRLLLCCLTALLAGASAFAPLAGRVGHLRFNARANAVNARAISVPRRSAFKFGFRMEEGATTLPRVVAAEDGAVGKEQFSFTKQWYPMAVVEFLDPKKPHPVQLMGKDLVMWQDVNTRKWNVFEDACPHRLAPLSEGRIEPDGTLLCAYHAWRFNAKGECTSIPHAQKDREADLCALPKACAISHPVQEVQGLLWVWGEAGGPGSDAAIEAALKQPAIIPELDEYGSRAKKLTWSIRDMPYGWDYFIENVVDPAHVGVAHHGITGNRYASDVAYDLVTERELSAEGGFKQRVVPEKEPTTGMGAGAVSYHEFKPPSMVHISQTYNGGKNGKFVLALYASPSRPGWVRHIGCQVLVEGEDGKLPAGLGFFALPMPIWLQHVLASVFLHQDMVFLHHQEKILARRNYLNSAGSNSEYIQHVFTPTPQDKGVIAFRKWLQYSAGGGVPWAPGSTPMPQREMNKEILFDVYNTHTKNCKICMDALKNLKMARNGLFAASFVTIGLSHGPAAVAGGAALAGVGLLINKLIGLFYKYEFEHAFND